jgi:hypothetical protein
LTQLQLQLTAHKTETNSINSRETSKFTAKKGKSIIPARRLFSLNRHYGSPMNTDSPMELGPLDNTSKNTKLKTQNYLIETLINTTKNHQNHQPYQPLQGNKPSITNNIHDCISIFTSTHVQTRPTKQKRKWRQKMAPKTIWIHNFIESAEPSTRLKRRQNLPGSTIALNQRSHQ